VTLAGHHFVAFKSINIRLSSEEKLVSALCPPWYQEKIMVTKIKFFLAINIGVKVEGAETHFTIFSAPPS